MGQPVVVPKQNTPSSGIVTTERRFGQQILLNLSIVLAVVISTYCFKLISGCLQIEYSVAISYPDSHVPCDIVHVVMDDAVWLYVSLFYVYTPGYSGLWIVHGIIDYNLINSYN